MGRLLVQHFQQTSCGEPANPTQVIYTIAVVRFHGSFYVLFKY